MNRMKALGINWNNLDPFPRYGPFDFPVITTPPTVIAQPSTYAFPVITDQPTVVAPLTPPAPVMPTWAIVGGAVLAGVALTALLAK